MSEPKFITVFGGIPAVSDQLPDSNPNRLGVMSSFWDHMIAYDKDYAWHIVVKDVPSFSFLQRVLAHTFWNPEVVVDSAWEIRGEYSLSEVKQRIEVGLETDDDIIQQWFGADKVMLLVNSASDFSQLADAIRCICGEFETCGRLRALVDRVLGIEVVVDEVFERGVDSSDSLDQFERAVFLVLRFEQQLADLGWSGCVDLYSSEELSELSSFLQTIDDQISHELLMEFGDPAFRSGKPTCQNRFENRSEERWRLIEAYLAKNNRQLIA